MKLVQLKEIVDSLVEKAGDCNANVEIWQDEKKFMIQSIGNFGIEPDMIIHILPVER